MISQARIKPFKTFSVSTILWFFREESSLGKKSTRFDTFRKPCGYPITQHCYCISQLKCPKCCVITHDVPLKAFSLQPIYLNSLCSSP